MTYAMQEQNNRKEHKIHGAEGTRLSAVHTRCRPTVEERKEPYVFTVYQHRACQCMPKEGRKKSSKRCCCVDAHVHVCSFNAGTMSNVGIYRNGSIVEVVCSVVCAGSRAQGVLPRLRASVPSGSNSRDTLASVQVEEDECSTTSQAATKFTR